MNAAGWGSLTMSNETIYLHGNGLRAAITSHGGRCLLEVTVETAVWPDATAVNLEILYQARAASGLAVGSPTVLHQEALPLAYLADDGVARARTWLPVGLDLQAARNCHYRILPGRMGASEGGGNPSRKNPDGPPRQPSEPRK